MMWNVVFSPLDVRASTGLISGGGTYIAARRDAQWLPAATPGADAMTDETTPQPAERTAPRWQPLSAIERRVVGVLAEKAKTTPDAYPMSLNAICTGCNQKSNRHPLMQLEPDDIETALDRLRQVGAVGMIEGYGRVTKYRHYLYEWLGVDKVEIAVMTELLLRGAQTEGELRGRAARMEPIADLSALRPILDSLRAKRLVISLTPEGRGHVITHALHQPRELEHLRVQYGTGRAVAPSSAAGDEAAEPARERAIARPAVAAPPPAAESGAGGAASPLIAEIRRDIQELRAQLIQLQSDVHDLATRQSEIDEEVRGLKDSLGG
jgi:hypothetical protein